jgi:hypothetical protein
MPLHRYAKVIAAGLSPGDRRFVRRARLYPLSGAAGFWARALWSQGCGMPPRHRAFVATVRTWPVARDQPQVLRSEKNSGQPRGR